MKAVIYTRVSTDEQASKGYSLPTQLEACRKYAQEKSLIIVGEFCDDFSGARLDRPQLDKLRELITQSRVDAVIVYDLDRLSRSLVHQLILEEEFSKRRTQLHCVLGQYDNSPEGKLQKQLRGAIAEYEREKIRERVMRGKRGKAKAGIYIALGHPPYGYRRGESNGHVVLVIDKEEAKIVVLIYTWYVLGDEDSHKPMSIHAIWHKLSKMGIPAPGVSRGYKRLRKSFMWSACSVRFILTNETYAGVWRYGKRMGTNGKGGIRPLDEQIPVPVLAMIDRKLWTLAQKRREYNKQLSKRNNKHDYLLRGMIRCGCGRLMAGRMMLTKYSYYGCTHRSSAMSSLEDVCREKEIRTDLLDAIVWKYVSDVMSDPVRFEKALRDAQTAEMALLEPKRDQLATILKLIEKCEADASKLASAFANVTEGVVSKALRDQIERVDQQYAALIQERDALQKQLGARKLTDENIDEAMRFREDVISGMQNATDADKRRALELLQVQVAVKNRQARVRCLVLVDVGEIDLSIY